MNRDWADLLALFAKHDVAYVMVGGTAAQYHGVRTAPGDLDLYVRANSENGARILAALREGAFPSYGQTPRDFENPSMVLRIGAAHYDPRVPPNHIDIHTSLAGVPFESAYRSHVAVDLDGTSLKVLSRNHLVISKREAGRPKDLEHLRQLEGLGKTRDFARSRERSFTRDIGD
jgi:predicted nucleotidyltransferase